MPRLNQNRACTGERQWTPLHLLGSRCHLSRTQKARKYEECPPTEDALQQRSPKSLVPSLWSRVYNLERPIWSGVWSLESWVSWLGRLRTIISTHPPTRTLTHQRCTDLELEFLDFVENVKNNFVVGFAALILRYNRAVRVRWNMLLVRTHT